MGHPAYPQPPRREQVDLLHGIRVEDPFRELESADSPATRAWVEAQRALTEMQTELAKLPLRARIRKRLGEIMNHPRQSAPWKRGGRYFLLENSGLENQDRLVWCAALGDKTTTLLDPNTLSTDGTVALSHSDVSPDGRQVAYMLARSGSDWNEIRVRDVDTGLDLPDLILWVKFSGLSWTPDGKGFYYSRFDAPSPGENLSGINRFQKLMLHRLGTPQSADELVYERPDDGEIGVEGQVTDDGRYLVITGWKGTSTQQLVFVKDLARPDEPVRTLVGDFAASFHFAGIDGERLYFRTTLDAPRGRLVALKVEGDLTSLAQVIPETEHLLQSVTYVGRHFVAAYLVDAASELRIHDCQGSLVRELPLPGVGCVAWSVPLQSDDEYFYTFENLTTPPTVYGVRLPDGAPVCLHKPAVDFDPGRYETQRVYYEALDGTRIPMFIAAKKGLARDGTNPTLLYGYGGFNAPMLPWFRTSRMTWLELGGIFASACIRGGGEYGEAWHRAGIREKKQTVFDDFCTAATWLTAQGYTSPAKLAINGGSNGGLLVAACLTQKPELFGAVAAAVGVFDMLRFHKFTIGWAWVSDYGSPDDPEACRYLLRYSPLHNLKPGTCYPPTPLITTADHDDRVVPAHSYKFAAALQEAQGCEAPILLRVETKSGHGMGKPVGKLLDETADTYAFLRHHLGVD